MKKKRYTEEFKKEAVRYVVLEGETVSCVAERLGINPGLLYSWKKQYLEQVDSGKTGQVEMSMKEAAAELDRLRKELAKERRMNEILKKTVGYFAKDEK